MRNVANILGALCALAAAALVPASAEDFKTGALSIDDPWARPSIGDATNTAARKQMPAHSFD